MKFPPLVPPPVPLPTQFCYQLSSATNSVPLPTLFCYPLCSASHAVLLPTLFHYPLSSTTNSVPLPTQFCYPLCESSVKKGGAPGRVPRVSSFKKTTPGLKYGCLNRNTQNQWKSVDNYPLYPYTKCIWLCNDFIYHFCEKPFAYLDFWPIYYPLLESLWGKMMKETV